MRIQRCLVVFLLLTFFMGGVWGLTRVIAADPVGTHMLYMPQIGQAEPEPSEFIGLITSQSPGFPQTPLPVSEIYTVRGDGSGLTRLTTNELYDFSPQWSPDGSLILWRQSVQPPGTVGDEYSGLWLMNADGTNPRELTNFPEHERGFWSPDGSHIFIFADGDNGSALYITTPTAISPTLIFSDTAVGTYRWSPDEAYLAYSVYDNNVYDLYLMNPDGTGVTLVAEDANEGFEWSPDSQWLVYSKTVANNEDVYITRIDGSDTRRLTTDPAAEQFAAWVEMGARLLVSRQTGNGTNATDLVAVADGEVTPFLTETASIRGVAPDGQSVAYVVSTTEVTTVTRIFFSVLLKPTDGGTAMPLSPALECGATICGINFYGWSATGRSLAYSLFRSFTPTVGYNFVYIATLEGNTPSYRMLSEGTSGSVVWLPYGEWLSAYTSDADAGNRWRLINTRTHRQVILPYSEDGRLLADARWRYQPE